MTESLAKSEIVQSNSAEQLELIALIWDSIGPKNATDIPEWHRREIDRRLAAADANLVASSS